MTGVERKILVLTPPRSLEKATIIQSLFLITPALFNIYIFLRISTMKILDAFFCSEKREFRETSLSNPLHNQRFSDVFRWYRKRPVE